MRSRAAILYEYGRPWSVEEFELDPPRSGEVLVRLAATGLCHSDEHIRKGGTCVLTGLPSPMMHSIAVTLQEFILMNKTLCGTVFGSCNPRSDIPVLATMYGSGQLLLDEMITKRYALDEINVAYADLADGLLIRGVIDFGLD